MTTDQPPTAASTVATSVNTSTGSSSSSTIKSRTDSTTEVASSTESCNYKKRHLFVLIHGFFGNPSNLESMRATLQARFPAKSSDVDILVPSGNTGLRSFDGVQLCAERIVEEIALHLTGCAKKKGVRYDRISIVGYSLGGLYSRYVIGILHHRGLFDRIRPVTFTTFACPHVGSNFYSGSCSASVLNYLGSNFLGVSGNDMFGFNSNVLDDLANPKLEFFQGLERFEQLFLFANAIHDRTVPFFTSFIADKDPFLKRDYVDFVYFAPPKASIESPDGKFLIDMCASKCRDSSNTHDTEPTLQERQFQVFITLFAPIMFPIVLTLTSITTVVSRYRVQEAQKLRAANKSILAKGASRSEGIAELAYYAIDDIFTNPDDILSPIAAKVATEKVTMAEPHAARGPGGYEGLLETTPDKINISERCRKRIEALNQLPWQKYAVRLRRMHSHAEIVNRRNKPGQGQQLLDFWVDLVASKI